MKNSFPLASILLSAFVLTANAAPVLTNGGFEQSPPPSNGNNIGWSISPWTLGGGSTSNVVKVDGPGGFDYGNQAPESDASAPGAGVKQHYLDITDGSNDFYQEFTPLCDGEVEYGAYFSRRTPDNNGSAAIAGIEIFRVSDNVSMAARQQTALMLGTPKTDPWTRVSYTTTLVSGTAYKFYVDMDNELNIDNAFVNFGPSCDKHDDFIHDPTDDAGDNEGPEVTFETTKTCSPLTQDENDAIKAVCEITINYDTGTFIPVQISLDESVFIGSDLVSTSITDITSTDDWDCGTLPVTTNSGVPNCVWNVGSTPPPSAGENSSTLNVTMEFPAESGQSWDDIKNCVSANIYVGGGRFLTSGDEPICVPLEFEKEEITIEAQKSCDQPTISPDGLVTANCKIEVTYDSKGTVPRMVNLSEQMFVNSSPAQTTIISIESDDAWECPALPLTNDAASLNCAWPDTADVPPPVGIVTSVLDVVVQFPTGEADDWQNVKNCVDAHFDTKPDLSTDSGEMVCVELSKPVNEESTDDPQQCVPFEPKVTCDTVNGGYQITLSNTLTGSFDPSSIDATSLTNGVTVASNPSNPLLLTLFGASPGQTVLMSLASTAYGKGSQPGLDLCCMGDVEVTVPEGLVCEPPRETVLEINKSCEPFDGGEDLGNTVCHIDVVYSGPAPTPANPISIRDDSNSTTGVISFNGQDPTTADKNEWDCSVNLFPTSGPAICDMHNGIDTTTTDGYWDTYTSTLDLYLTTEDEYKNCATASIIQSDDSVLESTNCYSKGDASLEITKTALFDVCHPGQICQFEYTVNNLGLGDYVGDITLQDTITPTGGSISNITPALCGDVSDLEGAGCTGNVSVPSNGSVTFTVDYLAPATGESLIEGENCVTLADETLVEFDDPKDIDGHMACTKFEIGAPVLEIEKIANGECKPESECSFTINVSTNDLPYDGKIALYENMGGIGGTITSISPLPSACTSVSPVQCILPVNLDANSTYSITVTSTYDSFGSEPEDNRNCVSAYMVDETVDIGDWTEATLTQDNVLGLVGFDCADFEHTDEQIEPPSIISEKTCKPITLGNEFYQGSHQGESATIECEITVTGENLQPGETILFTDEFTQGGYSMPVGGFLDGNVTSPENWTCMDVEGTGTNFNGYCSLPSDDLIAAGGTSVLNVVFDLSAPMPISGPLENCINAGRSDDATIEEQEPICAPIEIVWCAEGELVVDDQCVPNDPPETNITAVKKCGPALLQDTPITQYIAECTITVTADGSLTQPYSVTDLLLGANGQDSSHIYAISSSDNWSCSQMPYSPDDDVTCTIQLNNFPGDLESTINYAVGFDAMAAEGSWKNCIAGEGGAQYSCVDIEFVDPFIDQDGDGYPEGADCDDADPTIHPLADETDPDGVDNDCDGEIDEDVPVPSQSVTPILEPFKSQLGSCKINKAAQTYSCNFEIGVRNVGSGSYSGPMVLNDIFGSPKPRKVGEVQGDGWDCLRTDGAGTSCLNGDLSLAPGGNSIVHMSLTIPGLVNGGVFENCVGIGVGNSKFQQALIVQTIMKRLGIDGGPVDGAPGRKTREGIRVLQDRLGLEQTGELDNALFTALGIPSANAGTQECVNVQLPPMPQLPVSCNSGQKRNSKGQCYTPKAECKDGQQRNSKGQCYTPRAECKSGQRRNSKGQCYTPLSCQSRSTVKSGDGCACRYSGMRKATPNSCVCRNTGLPPIKGVGCPTIKRNDHDAVGGGGACKLKVNGICLKR